MSNQTLQKPPTKRRNQPQATKGGQPRRQTARLEGRRDGTPLIFGWGAHLTRKQKNQIKERAAYGFAAFVAVAVVAVVIFGVIQQTVIIPNQTILKVNGVSVAQDTYRKQLAYDAQVLWNRIQGQYTQYSQLATKAATGDATANAQAQGLQANIQADEGNYSQATITDNTMTELEEDQIIRQATQGQFAKDAAKLQPTAAAINDAVTKFKASFPPNQKYSDFLSKNNMSEADVRTAATVQLRRDLMQKYLAAQIVSPAKQVHIRKISTSDAKSAATVRTQLLKSDTDQTWTTLAKQDSVDVDSKNAGGDAGWIYVGGSDGVIENWAFAATTTVGDVSPVLADAAGTFDVVQVLGVDEQRVIASTSLSSAQSNALAHWIGTVKHLAGTHISVPDQNMPSATRNLPQQPDLNATLPNVAPSQNAGVGVGG